MIILLRYKIRHFEKRGNFSVSVRPDKCGDKRKYDYQMFITRNTIQKKYVATKENQRFIPDRLPFLFNVNDVVSIFSPQ